MKPTIDNNLMQDILTQENELFRFPRRTSRLSFRLRNIHGVELAGAKLQDTDFSFAEIQSSDFTGASLQWTDFMGARLQYVNLADANLAGACFAGASLHKVNVTGANIRLCHGDGLVIKSIASMQWHIAWTKTDLAIGCQQLPRQNWWNADDDCINSMDEGALEWWRRHKAWLYETVEIRKYEP